jgi:hypothetical protein
MLLALHIPHDKSKFLSAIPLAAFLQVREAQAFDVPCK